MSDARHWRPNDAFKATQDAASSVAVLVNATHRAESCMALAMVWLDRGDVSKAREKIVEGLRALGYEGLDQ